MGIQRTAILLAVSHGKSQPNHTWTSLAGSSTNNLNYSSNFTYSHSPRSDFGKFYGDVNILIGSLMLVVLSTIVCIICYCCHQKTKMRSSQYAQNHRYLTDNESNMEVYSVEQFFDISGYRESDIVPLRMINERPPSYVDAVSKKYEESKENEMTEYSSDFYRLTSGIADDAKGHTSQSIMSDRLNNNENDATTTTTTAAKDASGEEDHNGNVVSDEVAVLEDLINANGIIRLDLSKIMDRTGLPTYDAALKLKSSGYI